MVFVDHGRSLPGGQLPQRFVVLMQNRQSAAHTVPPLLQVNPGPIAI